DDVTVTGRRLLRLATAGVDVLERLERGVATERIFARGRRRGRRRGLFLLSRRAAFEREEEDERQESQRAREGERPHARTLSKLRAYAGSCAQARGETQKGHNLP